MKFPLMSAPVANDEPANGEPVNGEPAKNQHIGAQRVIVASVLWWLVALVFLSLVIAGLPAGRVPEFWVTVREQDLSAAWVGVGVLVCARVLTPLFARCNWAQLAAFIERRLLILCGLAFVLYAGLAFWAHHHVPLALDEYCSLTESRSFAAGQSSGWVPPALLDWITAPKHRGEFISLARQSGHYTPVYWPGLGILLTPFSALGVPWLCNPLLGCLALWGIYRLTFRVSGSREAAAWAWALTLASPVIALNAASFYAMPAHLLFNVFYCLLLLRGNRRSALGAGIIGGFALVLHNPLPHAAFALPWLLFIAWKRRRLLLPLLLGYLVFAVPLGLGWSVFVGSFDASKYAQLAPSGGASPLAEMLGRLATVVKLPTMYIVLARLTGLAKTVVWAVPGLLVLAWLGWRDLKFRSPSGTMHTSALRLMAASLFFTFMIYWLVPFDQTQGWGFRYIHSAWFVLPILGAVFLERTPQKSALWPFFAALCVTSFAILLPLRALQVEHLIAKRRAQVPAAQAPVSMTFINIEHGSFTFDLLQNDPFLRNNDWHLLSHGARNNENLARQYLISPRPEQSGEWGEIWVGSALRHPPFPPPHRARRANK